MKRNSPLLILLAVLSLVTGNLLSGISLIGRAGINVMYTEYKFLNTWWQGALLVFIVWLILLTVQTAAKVRASNATSNIIQVLALLIAIAGLVFSYSDFHNSISHSWLGQRFHFGVYLFWAGWILISVFLLFGRKQVVDNSINAESFN